MSINIGTPPAPTPTWTYISSVTVTNNKTITFSSLPAYDMYYFIGTIECGTSEQLKLTINSLGGTAYSYANILWSTGASSIATGQASVLGITMIANDVVLIEGIVSGKSAANASGMVNGRLNGGGAATWTMNTTFNAILGNAQQVTQIDLFSTTNNMTSAKFMIYGRNATP